MANLIFGYCNGVEYDEDFPMLRIAALVPNGVYNNELSVKAGTGMNVTISAGRGWEDGFFIYLDGSETISVSTAHPSLSRISLIVLRLNFVTGYAAFISIDGTPAVNPTPPETYGRTGDIHDLVLASILIPAGSSSITKANITDTRPNVEMCGITAGFQGLDVESLTSQAQAKFDEWFGTLQDNLSGNQAANLQNQINQLSNRIEVVDELPDTVTNGTIYLVY